jgi:hypothetical protein
MNPQETKTQMNDFLLRARKGGAKTTSEGEVIN